MIPGGVGGVATADGVVLAIGVGEGCTGEAGWEGSVAGLDPVAGGVEPVCEGGAGGADAAAGAVGLVGAGGERLRGLVSFCWESGWVLLNVVRICQ